MNDVDELSKRDTVYLVIAFHSTPGDVIGPISLIKCRIIEFNSSVKDTKITIEHYHGEKEIYIQSTINLDHSFNMKSSSLFNNTIDKTDSSYTEFSRLFLDEIPANEYFESIQYVMEIKELAR